MSSPPLPYATRCHPFGASYGRHSRDCTTWTIPATSPLTFQPRANQWRSRRALLTSPTGPQLVPRARMRPTVPREPCCVTDRPYPASRSHFTAASMRRASSSWRPHPRGVHGVGDRGGTGSYRTSGTQGACPCTVSASARDRGRWRRRSAQRVSRRMQPRGLESRHEACAETGQNAKGQMREILGANT